LYDEAYHIQIAHDSKFKVIEFQDDVIDLTTYSPPILLPEGKYYWRVMAKNSAFDGAYSEARIIIIDLTKPAAPKLNAPADGAEVYGTPNFTWSVPTGAKKFDFQFDIDPFFSDPYAANFLTKANHKPFPIMPADTYYWRVKAYDSAGNPSDWSTSRTVHILPATPARVTLISPLTGSYTDAGALHFTWTAVDYASRYELKIDNNSTFTTPEITNNTILSAETDIDINGLSAGKWYWQVRAVNANSVTGPWSTARYFYKSTKTIIFFTDVSALDDFEQHPGGAWHVGGNALYNEGRAEDSNTSSISYKTSLTNFSVNTRVKVDNASSEANIDLYGLVVRGTPTFTAWNDWMKGYYFMIIQDQSDEYNFGCFAVYSMNGVKDPIRLAGFCDKAILESDWNVLDVSANGKYLQFRVNGYLMWQGTNTSYPSGRVGLFNNSYKCEFVWCYNTTTHDRFSADYFRVGAPLDLGSADIRLADPALGVGPDPFALIPGE
jgi:hypothetical protein